MLRQPIGMALLLAALAVVLIAGIAAFVGGNFVGRPAAPAAPVATGRSCRPRRTERRLVAPAITGRRRGG
jgi:hypothetical protein